MESRALKSIESHCRQLAHRLSFQFSRFPGSNGALRYEVINPHNCLMLAGADKDLENIERQLQQWNELGLYNR
jgi:hypothetical protein